MRRLGPTWRRWVLDAVGPGAVVVRSRRLHGGITSVVHAVDVDDRTGARRRLVLRTYPPGGLVEPDPSLVEEEVAALHRLAAARIEGVPRVLAFDPTGDSAGHPAVLSTRLAGRPIVAAPDPLAWAEGLAAATVANLAALRRVGSEGLKPYEPWHPVGQPDGVAPPLWATDPGRWRRALAGVADAVLPSGAPAQPIHRDFNPGNLLWWRGAVGGVVDWIHLCHGPIEEDIARCRLNVWLLAGRASADRYVEAVESAGVEYDRTWDLMVLADAAHHLDRFAPAASRLGAALSTAQVRARAEEVARQ